VLVVPSYEPTIGKSYHYAFNILSSIGASFTTRLDTDDNLLNQKQLFLSYDVPSANYTEPRTSALFLSFLESYMNETSARKQGITGKHAFMTGN